MGNQHNSKYFLGSSTLIIKLTIFIYLFLPSKRLISQTVDQSSIGQLCIGNTIYLTVSAPGNDPSFQWQDSIREWNTITDDFYYSGSTNDTLFISNIPYEFNNRGYRCLVTYQIGETQYFDTIENGIIHMMPLLHSSDEITGPETVCAGSEESFYVADCSGATHYTWDLPTGALSFGPDDDTIIIMNFDHAVSDTLMFTLSNGCYHDTIEKFLEVIEDNVGEAGEIYHDIDIFFCEGESVSFFIDTVEGADTYTWDVSGTLTKIPDNGTTYIDVLLEEAGEGIISVTPKNGYCDFSGEESTIDFTIHPLPEEVTLEGKDPVCRNEKGLLYQLEKYESEVNLRWNIDGGTILNDPESDAIQVDWDSDPEASLYLTLTSKQGCQIETSFTIKKKEYTKTNIPDSAVEIKYSDGPQYILVCNATFEQPLQYIWGFTNKNNPEDPITIEAEDNGKWYCRFDEPIDPDKYWYWLKTLFEDDTMFECPTISYLNSEYPTTIQNQETALEILVYPNPAGEKINIRIRNEQGQSSVITLCDLRGSIVFKNELIATDHEITLDMNQINVSSGPYLLIIRTGNNIITRKLILTDLRQ